MGGGVLSEDVVPALDEAPGKPPPTASSGDSDLDIVACGSCAVALTLSTSMEVQQQADVSAVMDMGAKHLSHEKHSLLWTASTTSSNTPTLRKTPNSACSAPVGLTTAASASGDVAKPDIISISAAVAASKLGLTDQLLFAIDACAAVIYAKDAEGRTCLHYAAGYGPEDCVDVLLSRRADARARDCNGDVPLHFAAIHGHPMCAFSIAKACPGACLICNARGQTPVDVAVACERGEVLNAMLLACAGDAGPVAVKAMGRLLEQGAVPDTWAPNGSSALMLAASANGTSALQVLLEHGATVELQDALGRSALMFAAGNCAREALLALLDAGACIALRDRRGRSVLDYAPDSSDVRSTLEERLQQLEEVASRRQQDLLDSLEADVTYRPGGQGRKAVKQLKSRKPRTVSTTSGGSLPLRAGSHPQREALSQLKPGPTMATSATTVSEAVAQDQEFALPCHSIDRVLSLSDTTMHEAQQQQDDQHWKIVGSRACRKTPAPLLPQGGVAVVTTTAAILPGQQNCQQASAEDHIILPGVAAGTALEAVCAPPSHARGAWAQPPHVIKRPPLPAPAAVTKPVLASPVHHVRQSSWHTCSSVASRSILDHQGERTDSAASSGEVRGAAAVLAATTAAATLAPSARKQAPGVAGLSSSTGLRANALPASAVWASAARAVVLNASSDKLQAGQPVPVLASLAASANGQKFLVNRTPAHPKTVNVAVGSGAGSYHCKHGRQPAPAGPTSAVHDMAPSTMPACKCSTVVATLQMADASTQTSLRPLMTATRVPSPVPCTQLAGPTAPVRPAMAVTSAASEQSHLELEGLWQQLRVAKRGHQREIVAVLQDAAQHEADAVEQALGHERLRIVSQLLVAGLSPDLILTVIKPTSSPADVAMAAVRAASATALNTHMELSTPPASKSITPSDSTVITPCCTPLSSSPVFTSPGWLHCNALPSSLPPPLPILPARASLPMTAYAASALSLQSASVLRTVREPRGNEAHGGDGAGTVHDDHAGWECELPTCGDISATLDMSESEDEGGSGHGENAPTACCAGSKPSLLGAAVAFAATDGTLNAGSISNGTSHLSASSSSSSFTALAVPSDSNRVSEAGLASPAAYCLPGLSAKDGSSVVLTPLQHTSHGKLADVLPDSLSATPTLAASQPAAQQFAANSLDIGNAPADNAQCPFAASLTEEPCDVSPTHNTPASEPIGIIMPRPLPCQGSNCVLAPGRLGIDSAASSPAMPPPPLPPALLSGHLGSPGCWSTSASPPLHAGLGFGSLLLCGARGSFSLFEKDLGPPSSPLENYSPVLTDAPSSCANNGIAFLAAALGC